MKYIIIEWNSSQSENSIREEYTKWQNEIVKVNFDTQTVSARELHEQLHIGTEFAKWFSRMCEYGFSTGNDYSEVIVKNDENLKGGRPGTD